jgi:AbrB family looped-hinge helix DNA binding protein
METTMSTKGQIVIPAEIREQDHIIPGQKFEVQRLQDGEYLLKKKAVAGSMNLVEWLRQCPEKDWFTPLEFKETTDTLMKEIESLFEDTESP